MGLTVREPVVAGKKVLIVSRCSWTLYNFRRNLILRVGKEGGAVQAAGASEEGYDEKIEALGVPFIPLPLERKGINPKADLVLLWTLYRWYRRERPDVVHHFTIKPVIYGSLAARMAGVPRIVNTVTGLGYVFLEGGRTWLRTVVERLYWLALASADATFFQNREDKDRFVTRRLIPERRARLLPGSGVDLAFFHPDRVPSLEPPARGPVLLASRLLRQKGVYEFIEAARLVQAEQPEVRFELLGERDERNPTVVPEADLKTWVQEGVVTWHRKTDDVRPFLAQAAIVVLPSQGGEGIPRVLLEAAAMAKPVIVTDVTGCREVVENGVNGLLIPPRDPKALAAAIMCLITDHERRVRMGKAGRSKVEHEFSETMVLDQVLKVYNGE